MRRGFGAGGRGTRRGSALILVLLMTLAVAALAVAAIFMSSSAGLLSRFYDRERQFMYAAESALEQAISKLERDTSFAVTSTTPVSVIPLTDLYDASGAIISGARVQVWGALTGDTTSSGPITVTLLAQVSDVVGTRFVRRADLRRENFAAFGMLINGATTSSTSPYASGDSVVGRIHTNGAFAAVGGTPRFRDSVSSTGTIGDAAAAFLTAKVENARRVPWLNTDTILRADSIRAAAAGLVIIPDASEPTRVEFVWVDDGDGVPEATEGYVRVFDLAAGSDDDLMDMRPDINGAVDVNRYYDWNDPIIRNQCGAFYHRGGRWQFFPVATHRAAWARDTLNTAGVPAAPSDSLWTGTPAQRRDATIAVLRQPTARCFPPGSPFLVNTERFTDNGGTIGTGASDHYPFGSRNAAHRYGGSDTTFTSTPRTCTIQNSGLQCTGSTQALGAWRELPSGSGTYLKALDPSNVGAVLFATNNVRASGTVVGRVKLAVRGRLDIIDRIVHALGPNVTESDCSHLFGAVAENQIHIADNVVSRAKRVGSTSGTAQFVFLGGAGGFELHGAYLSLESTFGVEGNASHFGDATQLACGGAQFSGGCLRHVGSAAMMTSRAFTTGAPEGFRYRPVPDACFERGYRPPHWPATNRYRLIQILDVRPRLVIGNGAIAAYFASLQGTD